jgi:hypothetical protein
MKKLSLLIAVAVLSLAIAPAVEAQGFWRILEVKIRPGTDEAYEDFVKKIIEAHDKANSPAYWAGYQVVVGKPGGTYRFVRSFEKWADLDSDRPSNLAVLIGAFGEKEGKRMLNEGMRNVEGTMTRIWRMLPDATANADQGGQSKFSDVTIRTVRRDMVPDYRLLLRKYKEGYEASSRKPVVLRSTLVHGPSEGAVFFRVVPFNTWAERDQFNANRLLEDHFGSEEWESMGRIALKARMGVEHFVSQFRPDLSRQPQAATDDP